MADPIPLIIFIKALGIESDQEILQLIGVDDPKFGNVLAHSFQEAAMLSVFSQDQALSYISSHIKNTTKIHWRSGSANAHARAIVHSYSNNDTRDYLRKTEESPPHTPSSTKHFPLRTKTTHIAENELHTTLKQISQKTKISNARELLDSMILSHIRAGKTNSFYMKAIYLAHMARRMILALYDPATVDDKDFFGNKRIELPGSLLAILFEDLLKKFNHELKRIADQTLEKNSRATQFDIGKYLRPDAISSGITVALTTGNWRVRRFKMSRAGVTQVLSRLSYISALGMLSRVSSLFEKSRKVSGPRALQPSQWGVLCPSDTPEGESCGLVKNLSSLAHVTTDSPIAPLIPLCFTLGTQSISNCSGVELYSANSYLVLVNGEIIGVHNRPLVFASRFRMLRRRGYIEKYVSVCVDNKLSYIRISSDSGRLCRPLGIVKNGIPLIDAASLRLLSEQKLTFDDLVTSQVIEFLDVYEQNDALIAMYASDITPEHTHFELEPMSLLGVVAGLIPFPHHNQSPRNTYQCAMGKQAMGVIGTNVFKRLDTLTYVLGYPQKPLTTSKTLKLINFEKLPGGHNATIAVMSYSGYDIEDALVINKSSLDRGFGRCLVFRKYPTILKQYPNKSSDRLVAPDLKKSHSSSLYDVVDLDGICKPGEAIEPGHIFFNREIPSQTQQLSSASSLGKFDNMVYQPAPIRYHGAAKVQIDKVVITQTFDESILLKVQTRHTRRPEVGDKFSSRHGQKGVLGIIVDQADLPFSFRGVYPDMIMNPHGFPSRMTVGKLYELLASKAGVLLGTFGNGSAFAGDSIKNLKNSLVSMGYNYYGKEILTSGITGEVLPYHIFFGPVYYQKLKHMVLDKYHARSRGPRAMITRQPTEGRSRDGGLRLGEMERDCLIGHGSSLLLLERLMISSDEFTSHVCSNCGMLGYEGWCQTCRSDRFISPIKMPYACKLLFQEIAALGIVPKISVG